MHVRTSAFVASLLVTIVAAQAPPAGDGAAVRGDKAKVARQQVREVPDLQYTTGDAADDGKHRLDLYLPRAAEGSGKPPLVVFVHGGAWRSGDRKWYGGLGHTFAERGVACAVVGYRLSPHVVHPAHVEDVAAAFAWVCKHADEYGYDRDELFLCGHSAGAHLVALLATDPRYLAAHELSPKDVRGVAPISGPYDVSANMQLLVTAFGRDAAVRRDASPMEHVTKDAPPFLVLWGDDDMAGLPLSGRVFAAALQRTGASVKSEQIADRTHLTIMTRFGQADDRTSSLIFEFIAATAAPKPAAEPAKKDAPAAEPARR